MNKKTINILKCPSCDSDLSLSNVDKERGQEIISGFLICKTCKKQYSIKNTIAELVCKPDENIKKTAFAYNQKWKDFDYKYGKTYNLSLDERTQNFFKRLGINSDYIKNKTVLDVGCGSGQLAINIAKYGCEVIGTDISASLEKAVEKSNVNNIDFINADVMKIPFKDNTFDIVWCHGVLMNVSKPEIGFKNLSKLVKGRGKLYTMFYSSERDDLYSKIRLGIWRFIVKLPFSLQKIFSLPLSLILFLAKIRNLSSISKIIWNESKGQYYEMFTTPYIHRHKKSEIKKWYEENGFKDILIEDITSKFSFYIVGTKK